MSWQNSFIAGEVSPQAAARSDAEFYAAAAAELTNLMVLTEGGVTRCPGTVFVAELTGEQVALIPFSKANDDGVLIAAGGGSFQFFDAETATPLPASGIIATDAPLERLISGVQLIPGTGEATYALTEVTATEPAFIRRMNTFGNGTTPDVTLALDQLQATLPACRWVSVVVAWFGTSLSAADCQVVPGVEQHERTLSPTPWQVAGFSRTAARRVTRFEDRPAYGGTPPDHDVSALIVELKRRGFKVMFHPFLLMDMDGYPWRGRIVPSADRTGQARTHVNAFFVRWRTMIEHYAELCAAAGGVDAFLLGSELRGLTTARDQDGLYPGVEQLVALAQDVKTILPGSKVSYGADWTEWWGHQPSDGRYFHLDPLWAANAVDFIGVDNYLPLSDWRLEGANPDAVLAPDGPYDLGYLKGNIRGGEQYDYFYADDAGRDALDRQPISDGAHGEDWVFRPKDFWGWWSSEHRNRPGYIREEDPTDWVPRSKPIWFTELGCPPVHLGPNQPNVFVDPKSLENAVPYYSDGSRSDAAQRAFLLAHHEFWRDAANNPVSPIYGGGMVDPEGILVWNWDARPYPVFPDREDIWADAANWSLGNWLNGRAGRDGLSVVSPYADGDLPDIWWWQTADVMWLTSKTGTYPPQTLIRFDDASWDLRRVELVRGPVQDINTDPLRSLTASVTDGAVTLTSNFDLWASGEQDVIVRMFTDGEGQPYQLWTAEESNLISNAVRAHDGRVYAAVVDGSGKASNAPPVHLRGTVPDGGGQVSWTYLHDMAGYVRVTTASTARSATGTVTERLPQAGVPSDAWALGHFSPGLGWPFVGGVFQERLYFAGSPTFPDTLWATRVAGYGVGEADFKQGAGSGEIVDDDAFVRTLADSKVQRIAWLIAGRTIYLGHGGGVTIVSGPSDQEPITPAGAIAYRPDGVPGSSFDCSGIEAGDRLIYASVSGKRLIALDPRTMAWDELTALARDKGARPFRRLVWASEPKSRLYALRDDGRLFVCAFDVGRRVLAWSSLRPAGLLGAQLPRVLDIARLPGADGRDRLWLLVRRTINGEDKTFLEWMAPDFEGDQDRFQEHPFVDAAAVTNAWNSDPARSFTFPSIEADIQRAGQEVTLQAQGHLSLSAFVGRRLRLRGPDEEGEARIDVEVTGLGGDVLRVRLKQDLPAALRGRPLTGFAVLGSVAGELWHLEGERVAVAADGIDLGDFVVRDGRVDISATDVREAAVLVAGLRKPWRGRSLDLTRVAQFGRKGDNRGVAQVQLQLHETRPLQATVAVIADGVEQAPDALTVSDGGDLVSGLVTLHLSSSHGRTVQVQVSGEGTGPFTLLAMRGEERAIE